MSRQTNTPEYTYIEFLSSEKAQSTFRLCQRTMTYLREYLNEQGFVEFLPPVISSVADPGLSGAERVTVSLYNQTAYITSSMVFHRQVLATAFGSIYSFAPNVRLEPEINAQTGRHLVEFCQLDLEQADQLLRLAVDMGLEVTYGEELPECVESAVAGLP